MEPLKIMIKLYLLGEPITAWVFILVSIICTFTAFFLSRKKHENDPHYDRMFLMGGVFAAIGLTLLLHFFSKGSEGAVKLIQEAYKLPYLFK